MTKGEDGEDREIAREKMSPERDRRQTKQVRLHTA